MLDQFGVYLKPSSFKKDVKPLLKEACTAIFGSATGLTDMMVKHFPSSKAGSASKVGPRALKCSSTFPVLVQGLGVCEVLTTGHEGFLSACVGACREVQSVNKT